MCSRYQPAAPHSLSRWNMPPPDFAYGEAYPGMAAPLLTNAEPARWTRATFGLMPYWAKPTLFRQTYNARSETVGEKPSFRNAWKRLQLCVIPADAFYEPNYESGRAVPWRIERPDGACFGLAGIWERVERAGETSWSFAMLTINADEHPLMRRFHKPDHEKRSVVILPDTHWRSWLASTSIEEARQLLTPFDPDLMQASASIS